MTRAYESNLLGTALGIICIGLMFGAGAMDTVIMDFSTLPSNSVTIIRLGFFSLALFFFLEV